jgi:hypothetical protein
MSDDKCRAYQPTGSETLEKLVMDPNIPKSETEGWACREIERLRAENAKLKSTDMAVAMTEMSLRDEITRLRARVEVLERVLHAAKEAMAAVWVSRDKEHAILFQAFDDALVALEAKP